MKKIFAFLSIIALGSAFVACESLNEYPVFDDTNAFVEFAKTSATIDEDGGVLEIPITLASNFGITETISYETVDGTAKAGTDYELVDGSATLTFGPEARTQNVKIKIIERAGEYTGDLKFTVKIKSTGSVNCGVNDVCTVTISDKDHPLAHILGTYDCHAFEYYGGPGEQNWTCNITKDPDDVTIVWFDAIEGRFSPGYLGSCNIYGKVTQDEETGLYTISIPTGQETKMAADEGTLTLYHVDSTYDNHLDTDIVFTEGPSGTFTSRDNWVIEAYYYYSWVCGGDENQYHPDATTTFVKK